jgi:hypothetical protein
MVAGAATCVFRPPAAAPPANAAIAIKCAFPARGLTLSRRHGPQPRGKYGLLFYWLAMPFHNRNYPAFNHFLAGHFEGR